MLVVLLSGVIVIVIVISAGFIVVGVFVSMCHFFKKRMTSVLWVVILLESPLLAKAQHPHGESRSYVFCNRLSDIRHYSIVLS